MGVPVPWAGVAAALVLVCLLGLTAVAAGPLEKRLAVVGLLRDPESLGIWDDDATALLILLEAELLQSGNLAMVERQEIEKVRRELDLTASGGTSQASLLKLGRMLHADYLLWGRILWVSEREVALEIRAIESETARICMTSSVPIGPQGKTPNTSSLAAQVAEALRRPPSRVPRIAVGPCVNMSSLAKWDTLQVPFRIKLEQALLGETSVAVVQREQMHLLISEQRLRDSGHDPVGEAGSPRPVEFRIATYVELITKGDTDESMIARLHIVPNSQAERQVVEIAGAPDEVDAIVAQLKKQLLTRAAALFATSGPLSDSREVGFLRKKAETLAALYRKEGAPQSVGSASALLVLGGQMASLFDCICFLRPDDDEALLGAGASWIAPTFLSSWDLIDPIFGTARQGAHAKAQQQYTVGEEKLWQLVESTDDSLLKLVAVLSLLDLYVVISGGIAEGKRPDSPAHVQAVKKTSEILGILLHDEFPLEPRERGRLNDLTFLPCLPEWNSVHGSAIGRALRVIRGRESPDRVAQFCRDTVQIIQTEPERLTLHHSSQLRATFTSVVRALLYQLQAGGLTPEAVAQIVEPLTGHETIGVRGIARCALAETQVARGDLTNALALYRQGREDRGGINAYPETMSVAALLAKSQGVDAALTWMAHANIEPWLKSHSLSDKIRHFEGVMATRADHSSPTIERHGPELLRLLKEREATEAVVVAKPAGAPPPPIEEAQKQVSSILREEKSKSAFFVDLAPSLFFDGKMWFPGGRRQWSNPANTYGNERLVFYPLGSELGKFATRTFGGSTTSLVPDGRFLWVATYGDGIWRFDSASEQWRQFSTAAGNIPDDRVTCIANGELGTYLAFGQGTRAGVARLDEGDRSRILGGRNSPDTSVYQLVASGGNLWALEWQGFLHVMNEVSRTWEVAFAGRLGRRHDVIYPAKDGVLLRGVEDVLLPNDTIHYVTKRSAQPVSARKIEFEAFRRMRREAMQPVLSTRRFQFYSVPREKEDKFYLDLEVCDWQSGGSVLLNNYLHLPKETSGIHAFAGRFWFKSRDKLASAAVEDVLAVADHAFGQ